MEETTEQSTEQKPQSDTFEVKQSTLVAGAVVIAIIIIGFYLGSVFSDVGNSLDYVVDNGLLVSSDDDAFIGNEDSLVSIVEFSDFHCPVCGMFFKETVLEVKKNYVDTGKVNFVYRDFPILSLHANAGTYAQASECGDDQGKFWELHDIFYNANYDFYSLPAEERGESPFTVELLQNYSEEAGLDLEELNSCLDSGKYIDEVNNDLADGQFYGVGGTPNMFIVAKKELTDLQLSALNEIASIVAEQAGASYITIYNSEQVTTIHIKAALNYQTVSAILDVLV